MASLRLGSQRNLRPRTLTSLVVVHEDPAACAVSPLPDCATTPSSRNAPKTPRPPSSAFTALAAQPSRPAPTHASEIARLQLAPKKRVETSAEAKLEILGPAAQCEVLQPWPWPCAPSSSCSSRRRSSLSSCRRSSRSSFHRSSCAAVRRSCAVTQATKAPVLRCSFAAPALGCCGRLLFAAYHHRRRPPRCRLAARRAGAECAHACIACCAAEACREGVRFCTGCLNVDSFQAQMLSKISHITHIARPLRDTQGLSDHAHVTMYMAKPAAKRNVTKG